MEAEKHVLARAITGMGLIATQKRTINDGGE